MDISRLCSERQTIDESRRPLIYLWMTLAMIKCYQKSEGAQHCCSLHSSSTFPSEQKPIYLIHYVILRKRAFRFLVFIISLRMKYT